MNGPENSAGMCPTSHYCAGCGRALLGIACCSRAYWSADEPLHRDNVVPVGRLMSGMIRWYLYGEIFHPKGMPVWEPPR